MEVTERRSWAVAEQRPEGYSLLVIDLSEKEALEEAARLNAKGDFSYVAIPVIITNRRGSLAEFDRLYKRV